MLNFLWSLVFFAAHQIGLAFAAILLLLAAIIGFIATTWNHDRAAAWLFVPYAAWVAFASPAPKLTVDPPLPGPLARGAVIVPYSTENFRILPVFGVGARDVSPRAGHLHFTVDDLPWRWADPSNTNAVVVVGLPPGSHKILIELATPEHHVLTGQAVTFTVRVQSP